MDGIIIVNYRILCDTDLSIKVSLAELLANEKVYKAIKAEFAKGLRNVDITPSSEDASLSLESTREIHTFEVSKDDFANIVALAEDDAMTKKLFKKDCNRIELVDIETSAVL